MALKLPLEAYLNSDCNITVRLIGDLTPPYLQNLVLFWSTDNFVTQNSDFTGPITQEWTVQGSNGDTYEFVCIACMLWDPTNPGVVNSNVIIRDDQDLNYYQNTSGGTIPFSVTRPHSDLSNWTLVGPNDYAAFIAQENVSNIATVNIECSMFTVTQTDRCYLWTVNDLTSDDVIKTVNVYTYGSNTILSTYTLSPGGSVDIVLPSDNVYIVEVIVGDDHYYYLAYEICSIKTCYNALVNDILCNEWDPCCEEGCSEAEKKILQIKRDTLNQMVALVTSLIAAIWVEHTQFMGILTEYTGTADATRDTYIQRVVDLIAKINIIVGRCGICQEQLPITTTGCQTCGQ
jgi:hypothetical protein